MARLLITLITALSLPLLWTASAQAADPVIELPCISTEIVSVGCPDSPGTSGDAGDDADDGDGAEAEKTCRDADTVPTSRNATRIRRATLCLVNLERTARGRKALKTQRNLTRAATRYAKLMVRQKFFDHVSPSGSTLTKRVRSAGYLRGRWRRWSAGENLAWGTGSLATPTEIVEGWMNSPSHRRNILNRNFREAGFGVRAKTPGKRVRGAAATYVNVFGRRVRR